MVTGRRRRADQRGERGAESVITRHLLPYHNNQGRIGELNFGLNIGQNNSSIFDIWNQIIQTTGTSTNQDESFIF